MISACVAVLAYAIGAALLGWGYARRYRVARPPLGVIGPGDVAALLVGAILVPPLYLALPRWLVAGLLAAMALGVLHLFFEPLAWHPRAAWGAPLLLVGADLAVAH